MRKTLSLLAIAAVSLLPRAYADVKLPAIISDRMVLQRDMPAPIWGWADAGEEVKVSMAGQTKTAAPGADGRWMVKLDPLKGGEAATLTVQGKNTITVKDVLVGEVWLGSGQSNMAMLVQGALNFEQEKAAANLPEIRVFTEQSGPSNTPQQMGKGTWAACSPETVGRFSATLFFFGREIQKAVGGPVGLINSSVGGTPIESWIAAEVQQKSAELQKALAVIREEDVKFDPAAAKTRYDATMAKWKEQAAAAKAAGNPPPRAPRDPTATRARKGKVGELFNGKIAPLIPYGIRGALWYQGEANSNPPNAAAYEHQLPLLVTDWRARWGQGDFSFAWAQLPNFGGGGRDWPLVREAMLKTLRLKNTGMGINIDIGEEKNIHPRNKQEVGHRLALWALGTVYGKQVPAISGPLPAGHQVRGSEVVLSFEHTNGGLVAKEGPLKGFTIAGEDKKFVPATGRIDGTKVIVSSPEVPKPAAVRYSWANWPDGNLYNGAGLPASPFRTDMDAK
jgi:sialate O-acetylesterase